MPEKHLPQLDGLRGVAILIVLLGHIASRPIGLNIGWIGPLPPLGVDLFFVLSGFLITGVLLRAKGKPHFFRNFYARRVLRIAPLYYALLIFMFGIAHNRWVPFSFGNNDLKWWAFALYIQNLYQKNLGPMTIGLTWSLAIEEQFYTVWPWLVSKLTVRGVSIAAAVLVVVGPVARQVFPHYGWDTYVNPLCRIDAMAMGALVSLWIFAISPSAQQIRKKALVVAACVVALAVVTHMIGGSQALNKSIVAGAFTGMLMLSLAWVPLSKALSIAPLRETGKLSYCLYLVHPSVGSVLFYEMGGGDLRTRLLRSFLLLTLSYLIAYLSWRFFESPILSLKRYFESAKPTKPAEATEVACAL